MNVTEEEIRPEKIFNEYLRLTALDTVNFFSKTESYEISCPACGGDKGKEWVKKSLFTYKICPSCHTIYVSPRPTIDSFNAYYTDSPSTKFWASTFYKFTEAARREKLWKPKAEMIKQRILQFGDGIPVQYIIDIGGGYGVFDEEITAIMDIKAIVIEPSVHLAQICRDKGLEVVEKFMEHILPDELPTGRKCFVSFELFEHLHNPSFFLETVLNGMKKDDLFIFTTLSGMGIDIQILGEHSKSVSPPHHLNFMNPKSVTALLKRVGFEVLEATTPGVLDIDILKNNKENIQDRFWSNFLEYASEEELAAMQKSISSAGLSSHMMIVCKK
jgi:hypothetical protein